MVMVVVVMVVWLWWWCHACHVVHMGAARWATTHSRCQLTTLHVLIGVVYKAAACMLSCYAAIQQVLCCVRRVRATVMLADGS